MERFTCETRKHPLGVEIPALIPFVQAFVATQPNFSALPEECVAIIHEKWKPPHGVMIATTTRCVGYGFTPSEFCSTIARLLWKAGKRKLSRELRTWARENITHADLRSASSESSADETPAGAST